MMLLDDDLDAIDARHDEAVLIERKMEKTELNERDLHWLFACVSDIPELLKYVSKLRDSLAEAEACIMLGQGVLDSDSRAWALLDEYDGTGDSVRMLRERLALCTRLESKVYEIEGPGSLLCTCVKNEDPPTNPKTDELMDHDCECPAVLASAAVLGSFQLTKHVQQCEHS